MPATPSPVPSIGPSGECPTAARASPNRSWVPATGPAPLASATSKSGAPMPDSTIFEQVLAAARPHGVTEIEVILSTENQALTRFANNVIHQNVAEQTTHLSVRPIIDGRTARASTNCLDRYGIRNVVAEAVAITRVTEPDPDLL